AFKLAKHICLMKRQGYVALYNMFRYLGFGGA
ncbi:MAG: hypothetical protein ACI90E_002425, partial [Yoonia sp.]